MSKDSICLLYDLFADLLAYPTLETLRQAAECLEKLRELDPEAALPFGVFYAGLEKLDTRQIEEVFTSIFDMQPVCYPYIGFHLFGESYKRGAFMAQLNEAYRTNGYSAGLDLPDHLSAALRFLALDTAKREEDFGRALIAEGFVPALSKMLQAFAKQSENPYASLLTALHTHLVHTTEKELGHA